MIYGFNDSRSTISANFDRSLSASYADAIHCRTRMMWMFGAPVGVVRHGKSRQKRDCKARDPGENDYGCKFLVAIVEKSG